MPEHFDKLSTTPKRPLKVFLCHIIPLWDASEEMLMPNSVLVKKTYITIFILFLLSGCNLTKLEGNAVPTELLPSVSTTETQIVFPTSTIIPTITPTIVIESYPQIDGLVNEGEWKNISIEYSLPHGVMYYINDDRYLYILIDLVEDTGNDLPVEDAPYGDFFYITFDIEKNGIIDAEKDINYARYLDRYAMGLQYYLETDAWTGLYKTSSLFEVGFGPSFNSSTPHRIWEFAFSLDEIHAQLGDTIYVGVLTYSQTPPFDDFVPNNFTKNFSKLIPLNLR